MYTGLTTGSGVTYGSGTPIRLPRANPWHVTLTSAHDAALEVSYRRRRTVV